jgi:MFS superfamily sulfate permease-like transporter
MFMDFINLIPAAVFIGVLFKAGYDVCDKDFIRAYFSMGWFKDKVRNLQFAFIGYTTIVTVIIDLNVAVISGTILFYLVKYFWSVRDAETDFSDISAYELNQISK